ncbi:MAG: M20/M25/M40 family metallo-hydrolase [Clostridiales bacterium]|nr:M20/M25/M40 family metallo-hydrolase [Clostridiales bacterium]
MQDKIYKIMEELVALKSVSCTHEEYKAGEWLADYFKKIPYFKKHPELTGLAPLPGDIYGRGVAWALVLGNSPKTIISSGHYDVVGTDNYGPLKDFAYEIGDDLDADLALQNLDSEARADMESGDWIWGRGVADMKGGHAVHIALLEENVKLAEEGKLPGCHMYVAVPDEESFSAGMREGAKLIRELVKKYNLDIRMMIIPEPSNLSGVAQSMSLGTVGKMMPVVMVQGVTAHVGKCFNGLSPMSIMNGIYARTEKALEFCDSFDGEVTSPPTWQRYRDMKELYDVTIPLRTSGYFTLLCFERTPDEVIGRLKEISREALDEAARDVKAKYEEFKNMGATVEKEEIKYEPEVYTYAELSAKLAERDGEKFEAFRSELYDKITRKVEGGELNFPDATIEIMEKVMDYADLKQPAVLLAFAPPFYPPVNSDLIEGHENTATKAYEVVKKEAEKLGRKTYSEHYFMGISDGSYCAMGKKFDYAIFKENTPTYGRLYDLDFETIAENSIPFVLYGPVSKEYHQWTERVERKSLLEELPQVTRKLMDFLWS